MAHVYLAIEKPLPFFFSGKYAVLQIHLFRKQLSLEFRRLDDFCLFGKFFAWPDTAVANRVGATSTFDVVSASFVERPLRLGWNSFLFSLDWNRQERSRCSESLRKCQEKKVNILLLEWRRYMSLHCDAFVAGRDRSSHRLLRGCLTVFDLCTRTLLIDELYATHH